METVSLLRGRTLQPQERERILTDARHVYNARFPFADNDPKVLNTTLSLRWVIRCTIDNNDDYASEISNDWYIIRVGRKIPDIFDTPDNPHNRIRRKPIALEGPAAIGKTTLISELGEPIGGDMAEIRSTPLAPLVGGTDCGSAYFRQLMRLGSMSKLIDRSDWLSADVYGAYQTKFLFVFAHHGIRDLITHGPSYRTVIIDDLGIDSVDLHARLVQRGGWDSQSPLAYTLVTRHMFAYCAKFYELPVFTPAEFKQYFASIREFIQLPCRS